MILQEILNKTVQFFKDKNFESARLDAELLISETLRLKRIELYTNFEKKLNDDEVNRCREAVRRRANGEPVAYILGKKGFYHSDFYVDKNVLIPRPETETIIEEVLKFFPDKQSKLKIMDLGTGSGILACTLAREFSNSSVTALELSAEAISVAKRNAESLGVQAQINFINTDATKFDYKADEDIFGGMDVIVSNPPYIAENDPEVQPDVKKFEPHQALYAGEMGLYFIREWANHYSSLVAEPGIMIFEIGHTQGNAAKEIFNRLEVFDHVEIVKDLSGRDRFIKGIRNG